MNGNSQGLGTWGSLAYECPKNNFCIYGQVEPIKVPPLSTASDGASSPNKTGTWLLLIFIVAVIYIGFRVL